MDGDIDIRSKVLAIMNMIDENKNKSKEKTLSILLEVELSLLKNKINNRIRQCEDSILVAKQKLNESNNADQIKGFLENIKRQEKTIQILQDALQFVKQWKRDYCN